MKKVVLSTLGLLLYGSDVFAANFAVITSPPTILSLLVFLGGIGCLFLTLKILNLLRGGLLFKSWQIFMTGFIALVISQLVNLVHDFEIFLIPSYVVPAILTLAIGLFLYGILEAKKILE